MRSVDTNVLVRIATQDDAEQAAAAEAFIQKGAWVSHVVLAEFCWVLDGVYGFDRARIAAAVEVLLDHEHLVVQDADAVAAAVTRLRASRAVDFSDCLILEAARKTGHVPLGTFDRDLGKLAGAERLVV